MKRGVRSRVVRWLVVATLCALPMQGLCYNIAVSPNAVISNSIRPADGTTGQDILTGSGVKTGHIQDGAVTDEKISGTISGSKLGIHSHSGVDIIDGTIAGSKLVSGSVTANTIANGAVTDSKISGLISASKIADGVFQKKYANVVVVAKSGGDFTDPVAAVASITDASASNPYLVKIMPGVYETGGALWLRPFIEIEGSGKNVTKLIKYSNDSYPLVFTYPNTSIRNITLEQDYYVVTTMDSGSLDLDNVSIRSKFRGITVNGGTLKMKNSEIIIDAIGVGSSAIYANYSKSIINNSSFIGMNGIGNQSKGIVNVYAEAYISNSIIDGFEHVTEIVWSGNTKCLNVSNEALDPVLCQY